MASRRVVSFSLFGQNPKYLVGAIENAKLMPEIYPDWIMQVRVPGIEMGWEKLGFSDPRVPESTLDELRKLPYVEVIKEPSLHPYPVMYRLLAAEDKSIERMVFRDIDSRISKRERLMVAEWEKSKLPFHTIHDHPNHLDPVMGGMWGMLGGELKIIRSLLLSYEVTDPSHTYGFDQRFLKSCVYAHMKRKGLMAHGRGTEKPKRTDCRFVGEVFEADNTPRAEEWKAIANEVEGWTEAKELSDLDIEQTGEYKEQTTKRRKKKA